MVVLGDELDQLPHHLVSLEDLESLGTDEGTMQLSADGQRLAYTFGSAVWILDIHSNEVPIRIAEGFFPRWSPQGDMLAYYATSANGIQLWIFSLKRRSGRQLTHVPGGIDPDPSTSISGRVHEAFRYSWSPDGARLAFASRVPIQAYEQQGAVRTERTAPQIVVPGEPLVLTSTTNPDWTLSGLFAHPTSSLGLRKSSDGRDLISSRNSRPTSSWTNQIFSVSVSTGRTERVTKGNSEYFGPAWSPGGSTILCASSRRIGSVFGATDVNIYEITVSSGEERPVTTGPGVRWQPSWSPDGKRLGYLGSDSFYGQRSVFVRKSYNAGAVNVTAKLDRYVDKYWWYSRGDSVIVTYKDGVSHPAARVSVDVETRERVPISEQSSVPVSIEEATTDESGGVAWKQRDPVDYGTIRYLAPGARNPIDLVDLYPQTKHWTLGRVRVLRWKNGRGDEMEGALLLPANYKRSQRYPVIVDAYPLNNATDWNAPMKGNQAWASQGYVVFRPNPRAPHAWVNPWKSAAASLAGKGPKGWNVAVDDVLSGVKYLIAQRIADPERMCLYGFSNGAGVVNYLVTRTSQFKCAVSVAAALSDWVRPSLLNTGQAAILSDWAGTSLWDDPGAYIDLSAVFHLKTAKTPMLLAVGDNDGDFLLDTIEMYNGLRQVGVDVTFLRYPNQAHGFTGASLRDFWQREMSFFAKYLRPME